MNERRNVSGIFFRHKVDDKWTNVCFEELPKERQEEILKQKSPEWVAELALMLSEKLNHICESFGIASNPDGVESDPE